MWKHPLCLNQEGSQRNELDQMAIIGVINESPSHPGNYDQIN